MNINTIFDNNTSWADAKKAVQADYFTNMSKGQSPEILYIGCSDSRVTAEELMGLGPGQVFVHRNIANMATNTDMSAQGVINYAVEHLKVNHIVVCGHYYCGGVKAAMTTGDLGILNPYLRNIRDVYRLHKAELNAIADENVRYKRLVELNVYEQCVNILKTPEVQLALERGIKVHGWVFDIGTGGLVNLSIDQDAIITELMDIYRIDV